jgi:DNA-binding NarL/FixJ family response regulator
MNPNPPLPLEEHIRVLRLIVEGKTQDQIALEIGLSPETIKRRCRRAREFIGVETLYQAVAVAVARGWVSAPRSGKSIP